MKRLPVLHEEIDARVAAVVAARPDWPCRRGCDDCCRSLAEPPRITEAEWTLLREAIAALPAERLARVEAAFAARLAGEELRACPLLEDGACSVYAARPLACRTYGFYLGRDGGRWCARIEERVASGACDDVIFGNHDAFASRDERSLLEWYRV